MGILSRIFRRREKPINVLAPLDASKGQYVFTKAFRMKIRSAQNVPDVLRDELLRICADDKRVSACYPLDVMEQPTGDIKFFVDLRLDDAAALHEVAPRMQRVLSRYDDFANRFFIGAGAIGGTTEDQVAYRRTT